MAKNIALSDEIYGALAKIKRNPESFSDVIKRLLPKNTMLQDLIGRNTFTIKEWKKVEDAFSSQEKLHEQRRDAILKKIS